MVTPLDWQKHRQWLALQHEQTMQAARDRGNAMVGQSQQALAGSMRLPGILFEDPNVRQSALSYQTPGADAQSMRSGQMALGQDYKLQQMDVGHEQRLQEMQRASELRAEAATTAYSRRPKGRGRKRDSAEDKYMRLIRTMPRTPGEANTIQGQLFDVWRKLSPKRQEEFISNNLQPMSFGTEGLGKPGGSQFEMRDTMAKEERGGRETVASLRATAAKERAAAKAGEDRLRLLTSSLTRLVPLLSDPVKGPAARSEYEKIKAMIEAGGSAGGGGQGDTGGDGKPVTPAMLQKVPVGEVFTWNGAAHKHDGTNYWRL